VSLAFAPPALAEETAASIKTFAANPIADGGGTCSGCGHAFHLELEYVLEGEGYGPAPSKPKGGVPPLSAIKLYLPEGVQEHPAPFGHCSEQTLRNRGAAGCPANSVAGEEGRVSAETTFGYSRVSEQGTLQAFFDASGLIFFAHGSEPVNLEIVWGGAFSSSHQPPYEEELVSYVPAIATVPGAPLTSIDTIHIKLGASTANGVEVDPYLTLPKTCPTSGFQFKTEVVFGGMNGGEREFGIPTKTVTATATGGCAGVPPPPPPPPPPPTSTEIAALLAGELAPSGKAARIRALLKRGYFARVMRALEAGTETIDWYRIPRGAKIATAHNVKPMLVAAGAVSFSAAGSAPIKIKLTRAGKRLLRHAKKIALTATGTFTPIGGAPVVGSRSFTIRR
jgi:hypothetical protein